MAISIKTTFYHQGLKLLKDDSYNENYRIYSKAFEGRLMAGNIWVDKILDKNSIYASELDECINFKYNHNDTYDIRSKHVINTHIDRIKRIPKTEIKEILEGHRVYIKLNWWQRNVTIKWIKHETFWHKHPIEFLLLLATMIGIGFTVYFSHRSLQIQELEIQSPIEHTIIEDACCHH